MFRRRRGSRKIRSYSRKTLEILQCLHRGKAGISPSHVLLGETSCNFDESKMISQPSQETPRQRHRTHIDINHNDSPYCTSPPDEPGTPPPSRANSRRNTIGCVKTPQAPLRGRQNTHAYLAAIRRRDCGEILRLADAGVDVNTPIRAFPRDAVSKLESSDDSNEEFVLPLLVASAEGSPTVIESLLDAGASINSVNTKDHNALHILSLSPVTTNASITPMSTGRIPSFAMGVTANSEHQETPKIVSSSPLPCALSPNNGNSPMPVENRKRRRLSTDARVLLETSVTPLPSQYFDTAVYGGAKMDRNTNKTKCSVTTEVDQNGSNYHQNNSQRSPTEACILQKSPKVVVNGNGTILERSLTPPRQSTNRLGTTELPHCDSGLSKSAELKLSAEVLLSRGIDYSHRDIAGKLAIDYATDNKHIEIVEAVKEAQRRNQKDAVTESYKGSFGVADIYSDQDRKRKRRRSQFLC